MYLLLIFLSFIGSCFAGLLGKQIGSWGASKITIFCLFFSFILSLTIFYEVALLNCPVYLSLFSWFNSGSLNIFWGFIFDSLSVTMCVVVTFISFLVHLYSTEYMAHDPHIARFMSYLSLFTFFMLILISADNFVQMFVGWEGVGLCSYLLINFWFTRIQANKAAIKAMIVNRIGDFNLVLSILILFVNFKSLDYSSVAILIPFFKTQYFIFFNFNIHMVSLIGFFMFIGAIGKSAQLGLHTWLPDAMEGPTPVSALIHAATMVTAGVFLIVRTSFIYEYAFKILEIITLLAAITAFLASSIGLVQNDLKRVIAYSTCSQLGYMVFACGLSNYSVGIFHLTNHAFFKALLFLSAGSIIHSINDEQDMRKMGGLKNFLPFTYMAVVCGSLALIGFPFLTGFYSKDFILETAFSKYTVLGFFSYFLGSFGAFFTAFYSTRLLFLTFLLKPNGYKKIICFAADSGLTIKFVLGCLSIPSIFIGYLTKDLLIGLGSNFFENSIFISTKFFKIFDAEFISFFFKVLPVHFSLLGFIFASFLYSLNLKTLFSLKFLTLGKKLYIFLNKKWYFDKIYNEFFSSFFFKFGYSVSYKFIDRGIFEIFGPTGFSLLILNFSLWVHKFQTNFLYHLVLTIFFSTLFLFFFDLFKILIFINEHFFNFYNNYSFFFNYIFSIISNALNFELLFINFIILIIAFKTNP